MLGDGGDGIRAFPSAHRQGQASRVQQIDAFRLQEQGDVGMSKKRSPALQGSRPVNDILKAALHVLHMAVGKEDPAEVRFQDVVSVPGKRAVHVPLHPDQGYVKLLLYFFGVVPVVSQMNDQIDVLQCFIYLDRLVGPGVGVADHVYPQAENSSRFPVEWACSF